MDSKSAIFIAMGSLLVMAIYSPIMNFVSAVSDCYRVVIVGGYICKTDANGVSYCHKVNGIMTCDKLNSVPTPHGIEQALQDTVKEETQTNTNDSKDIGGMQTDKGITKSSIN